MVPGAGGYELKRDDGTSAAEQLARLVPKGRVVTAFTSISSALIRDQASGEKPTAFTCADDEAARSTVIALAKEIGFEGVDAGHLDASRNIENLGLLVAQLAYAVIRSCSAPGASESVPGSTLATAVSRGRRLRPPG